MAMTRTLCAMGCLVWLGCGSDEVMGTLGHDASVHDAFVTLADGATVVIQADGGTVVVTPDGSPIVQDAASDATVPLTCGPGTKRVGNQCLPDSFDAGTPPDFCVPEKLANPSKITLDSNLQLSVEGGLVNTGSGLLAVYGFAGTSVIARTISPGGVLGTRHVHAGYSKFLGNNAAFSSGRVAVLTNRFNPPTKLLILESDGSFKAAPTVTGTPSRVVPFSDGFAVVYPDGYLPVTRDGVPGNPVTLAPGGNSLTMAADAPSGLLAYAASSGASCQPLTVNFANAGTVQTTDVFSTGGPGYFVNWTGASLSFDKDRFFLTVTPSLSSACGSPVTQMDTAFRVYGRNGGPLSPPSTLGIGGAMGLEMVYTGKFIVLAESINVNAVGHFLSDANGNLYKPLGIPVRRSVDAKATSQAFAAVSDNTVAVLYATRGATQVDPSTAQVEFWGCP